jgi:Domain of unknown function (DUF4410)
MKYTLLAFAAATAACAFYGCAGAKIAHTDVATGAYKPKAIYVRSYIADNAPFHGHHGDSVGEHKIRKSLAPAAFSKALKEEMERLAPAMVIDNDETPPTGWLVESDIDYASAGSQTERAILGPLVVGHSCVKIHVRITDMDARHAALNDKDTSKGGSGAVIYEFDVSGGSSISGAAGTVYAPGLGNPEEFDYKNAAERIYYALSIDPQRFGVRDGTSIRY